MHVQHGIGQCPLCHSHIEAKLNVEATQSEPQESKLGWDKRAFRRPATTTKPMWQPLHQSAE